NGILKETSNSGTGASIVGTYAPVLGNDSRSEGDERNVFAGYISDCAVFSTALSQSQVSTFYNTADKTTVSKSTYPSMMINWVLTEGQQTLFYVDGDRSQVTDYSGNGNHARLCNAQHYYDVPEKDSQTGDEWFTAKDGEYTMIFIPDTQCTAQYDINYYEKDPTVKSIADLDLTKTFQWMVDNKDAMNLSFVMHLGDLKQSRGVVNDWSWGPEWQNDWREWQLISGYTSINPSFQTGATMPPNVGFDSSFIGGQDYGFGLLRANGIPYSAILGNHDYDDFNMGTGTGRNADYYNYYFSSSMYDNAFPGVVVARYNNNTTEFAKNNNTMMNVIYEIDATPKGSSTPVKYLIVALEYGPDDDMLAWANEVVSQPKYASHRIILNTHALMYSDGEFMGENSYCNPNSYGWYNTAGVIGANNGQQIYDKVISQHANSFMSVGGHISEESLKTRTDVTSFGNTVYSMLVDLQAVYDGGGDSVFVVAKINENTKKITFRVYNPVTNKFYNVENEIEYDFSNWEADKHTVTWKNYDGTTLETDNVLPGLKPEFNGVTPVKPADANNNYVFIGWSTSLNGTPIKESQLPIVSGNATYYAIFASDKDVHTITWIVDGNSTTTAVFNGEMPVFEGIPYKYGYVFTGWDKQIVNASGN
ncbi:MAG: hypothetical protein J6A99_03100, partial [Clostridia bacterium]|nr:hypothetical protein [Clostridia bacterium]